MDLVSYPPSFPPKLQQVERRGKKLYYPLCDLTVSIPYTNQQKRSLEQKVSAAMSNLIKSTAGLGLISYNMMRTQVGDVKSRLERILMSTRILFLDVEGEAACKWGVAELASSSMGFGVFQIHTLSHPPEFPLGTLVLGKGVARERLLLSRLGKKIDMVDVDDLIPWTPEPIHSPLGGVLQMLVRIFALRLSVPFLKFDYVKIFQVIKDSSAGLCLGCRGTIVMTDIVGVCITNLW